MASLRRFGQQKPIVIDSKGVFVAGNGMLQAAQRLGWTEVLVIDSALVGVDRVAYAIADNRTAELSQWDREALIKTARELDADMLEATGWTLDELDQEMGDRDVQEDDGPPEPRETAVAIRGDVWLLGEHRLMCGDSTNPQDVAKLMAGELAALVATDPPYLVDYTGARPEKNGRDSGKDWSDVYHEIDIKDADAFFRSLFSNIVSVMAPHAAVYTWHAHRRCGLIQRVWEELGILDHQQIVWVKPNSVFGRVHWHFQHEPCMMGWKKGSLPRRLLEHEHSSVWHVDWEGKSRVVGNEHPTQKPLELFARPMKMHTVAGDVVFEPFSGSGSQLIAAEQLGRKCRAIEIEPVFVDVAIRRWQTMTGQAARLGSTGLTWEQTAQERAQCPKAQSVPAIAQDAQDSPPTPTATSTAKPRPKRKLGETSGAQPPAAAMGRRGASSGA
jgi:DNA modification methylase